MIRFFRGIKLVLLDKHKWSRYLAYAVGEIALVMVGILLALQINNWNENRKDNLLLKNYTQNLISELKNELLRYDELDSINKTNAKNIYNYLAYYNLEKPNLDSLISKRDTLKTLIQIFTPSTFTIQDLISTGNLKLLTSEARTEILKFQSSQAEKLVYVNETFQLVTSLRQDLDKEDDLLYRLKFSTKQHKRVKNWRQNFDSDNYLLDNNMLARHLTMYLFQERVHNDLRNATKELLGVLENPKNESLK